VATGPKGRGCVDVAAEMLAAHREGRALARHGPPEHGFSGIRVRFMPAACTTLNATERVGVRTRPPLSPDMPAARLVDFGGSHLFLTRSRATSPTG
jgi:hypothetical protein